MYVCVLPVLHIRCTHSPHRTNTHAHTTLHVHTFHVGQIHIHTSYILVCVCPRGWYIHVCVFPMWRGGVCTYMLRPRELYVFPN